MSESETTYFLMGIGVSVCFLIIFVLPLVIRLEGRLDEQHKINERLQHKNRGLETSLNEKRRRIAKVRKAVGDIQILGGNEDDD